MSTIPISAAHADTGAHRPVRTVTDGIRLTEEERHSLQGVLGRCEPITILLWGVGANRNLSFYADGTRLEARISYPSNSARFVAYGPEV